MNIRFQARFVCLSIALRTSAAFGTDLRDGLAHPELFHYVLAYSGGFGSLGVESATVNVEMQAPWKELLANPDVAKRSLRLLFLGCGQDEAGLFEPGKKLAGLLKEKGVRTEWADHPGGHVFSVWRNHLNESVPMLFQK